MSKYLAGKFINRVKAFNFRKWWLLIAVCAFLVFMTFFDNNNFIQRIKYRQEISFLKSERERFRLRIRKDSLEIENLKGNVREVERTAREKYGFKSPDEDVFILKQENEDE